jgi:hypothetical protein
VAHYLLTYPIDPEFNPAGECQRAPWTTSMQRAIDKSRTGIERHVHDALDVTRELGADGTIRALQVQMLFRKHNVRMPDIGEITALLSAFGWRRYDDTGGPLWCRPVPVAPSS